MSVEKVVATIEVPISHHGAERPEAKNSAVPVLARRAKKTAGAKAAKRQMAITTQSIAASCMKWSPFPCQDLSRSMVPTVREDEEDQIFIEPQEFRVMAGDMVDIECEA